MKRTPAPSGTAIFANSLDYWSATQGAADARQVRKLHGLTIIIENPQYSLRQGHGWMSAAPADYGYIEGTTGADGDEIDCYVGDNPASRTAYIVDQDRVGSSEFDEHKVFLNYPSLAAARQDFLDGHSEGAKILRAITAVDLDTLKAWLKQGKHDRPYGQGKR